MRVMISILFIFSGLLLVMVSLPLRKNKVKPNWLYGLRTQATMNDPEVWYKANQQSAFYLMVVGWLSVVTAIVTYFVSVLSFEMMVFIDVIVITLGTIWAGIKSIRLAKNLAQEKQKNSESLD